METTRQDHLRKISGSDLHERTLKLVAEERRVSIEVLWHLKAISERWLYLEMGYPSLWAYCTQALKYSSGAAYRRISAMRALSEDAELVEACLQSGELSLTTVAQIESFCSKAETQVGKASQSDGGATIPDKKALLEAAAQKSSREVQRMLASFSPEACQGRPDQVRAVGGDQSEVRFMASQELLDRLERVKDLCAHAIGSPHPSYAELFQFMADRILKRVVVKSKPETKMKAKTKAAMTMHANAKKAGKEQSQSQPQAQEKEQKQVRTAAAAAAAVAAAHVQAEEQQRFRSSGFSFSSSHLTSAPEVAVDTNASTTAARTTKGDRAPTAAGTGGADSAGVTSRAGAGEEQSTGGSRRHISAPLRREIFHRAGFQCEYIDSKTKRRCSQRRLLEVDHIHPFALGGSSVDPRNLRLVCRAHNQWFARKTFGTKKIDAILRL